MIRAKKSLGQNFLTDHRVARRIIDAVSPLKTEIVIEIGPGTGALTRLLVERSGHVEAVEIEPAGATPMCEANDALKERALPAARAGAP